MKNEVDDAPGIEGLRVVRICRLTVGVHAPTQRRLVRDGSLNMRQCHGTWGLLCNGRVLGTCCGPGAYGERGARRVQRSVPRCRAGRPERRAQAHPRVLVAVTAV